MSSRATPARPVEVHAWLDVACPWCWIAKRRFEAAEVEFGGDVTLEYHSFELAPDLPADYVNSEADFLQFLYAGTTREQAEQLIWVVRGMLFSAFFERGRDLRRVDELVVLADEVGLDACGTRTVLESGRYADAVRDDRRLAATYGVAKIPTYVMGNRPPIHGAKRPAVLIEALRTAARDAQGSST